MIYLGIDPGQNGGLAAIFEDRSVRFTKMPERDDELLAWIERMGLGNSLFAVLEKVTGYIGTPQPGSSMFNFGVEYGRVRMALVAQSISMVEVPPTTWQAAMGVLSSRKKGRGKGKKKGLEKREHKQVMKQRAEELYPKLLITDATADALLLAWYAKYVMPR